MEEEREGDLRVPLISSLFCLCVVGGGILLCIYLYFPDNSQPYFPFLAMVLIATPWVFWALTYCYACTKHCFRYTQCHPQDQQPQVSRRSSRPALSRGSSSSTTPAHAAGRSTADDPPAANSPDDQRRVHFGNVVVLEGDDEEETCKEEEEDAEVGASSSTTSPKEAEIPLTLSVKA